MNAKNTLFRPKPHLTGCLITLVFNYALKFRTLRSCVKYSGQNKLMELIKYIKSSSLVQTNFEVGPTQKAVSCRSTWVEPGGLVSVPSSVRQRCRLSAQQGLINKHSFKFFMLICRDNQLVCLSRRSTRFHQQHRC